MTVASSSNHRDPRSAIGLDIGGTKIAAGVVDDTGQILAQLVVPAPRTDREIVALLQSTIDGLRHQHPEVRAIGVGAAGMVDWPSGFIRWAPNNPYEHLPLADMLAEYAGLPTVVENDANAAAAAEGRFGSGAGHRYSLTLTIGTGIGGGILLDGQLYRGPSGIAAEVGHMTINPRYGPRCSCGATGCLEAMASGTALTRAGREAARSSPTGAIARLVASPEEVTGETVFQAAEGGDPTARGLFDELGYWLGAGIASLVTLLDPEVVILAGGVGGSVGDLLLAPTRRSFEHFVFAAPHRTLPAIVAAGLGPQAGLIGAATLALDQVPNHYLVHD